MTKLRIIHLSDIHFGQEVNGTLIDHDDVRAALVRDCIRQTSALGKAIGIVVTGDIAFSGKKPEYDRAGAWLDMLCDKVGCHRNAVHTIAGNHDVDISKIDFTVELLHKSLRECAPDEVNMTLAKIVGSNPAVLSAGAEALFGKLAAYREFASRYQSDFESEGKPVCVKEVRFASGHTLRFLGMTSVQVSDLKDEARKMVLGNQQYVFGPEENVEYVVLSHHPFDWFKDRTQAMRHITTRGRLMLAGHEHQPAFKKVEELGHEYLMLDAGATNPPGSKTREPHCYSWIEFDLVEQAGTFGLRVCVHPRVWAPEQADFGADQTRIGGATSQTFVVRCPNYKPIAAAEAPAAAAVAPVPIGVSETEATTMPDDERFAKLMYFFWRYLDWQQRYGVLAKIDVLPRGLDRPMPQMVERSALATARNQQKLSAVWNEVMQYVPEPDREANPY